MLHNFCVQHYIQNSSPTTNHRSKDNESWPHQGQLDATASLQLMVPLSILQNDLILPIITPRFALSCDMKLMERLGQLAARYDVHIQVIYFII
jgi:cytosine/adenosine deaminase-related metal-dependent hydrolase